MTTAFLIAAALYTLELLWLRRGLYKARQAAASPAYEPTVSVIVAARNEEDRIADCLSTLAALEYPASKLELIIVDDRSTDRTAEIIGEYSRMHPAVRKVTSGLPGGNLFGKANALSSGVEASTGEILMFTDADCTVQPAWIRATVRSFDETTGVVGGFTLLTARGFFEGMQQLDWMFLFSIASSAAGWGLPLTAIGNNFAVRKAAYDASGGYREIPFSVTEDYSLVQAILRKTSFTVRFPLRADGIVSSQACQSFRQLFRQKQRWGVGGLDMVPRGLVIMAVGWLYRALLVTAWMFVEPLAYLGTAAAIMCVEMWYLATPLRACRSLGSLRFFPVFQLYYIPYVLCIPLVAMVSRNIVWKERTLKKEGN